MHVWLRQIIRGEPGDNFSFQNDFGSGQLSIDVWDRRLVPIYICWLQGREEARDLPL